MSSGERKSCSLSGKVCLFLWLVNFSSSLGLSAVLGSLLAASWSLLHFLPWSSEKCLCKHSALNKWIILFDVGEVSALGCARVYAALLNRSARGQESAQEVCKCAHPASTILTLKGALPPTSTAVAWSHQDTFHLVTATSWVWSQSWCGSNCIQQAKKMQQLILTWLKSQLGFWWLLFPSVCLRWLSLTASQRCNFLHIPLDLLLYYCLQNSESRFCICGKSCWELSPLWPHVLQVSHFSVLLLIVQICNF